MLSVCVAATAAGADVILHECNFSIFALLFFSVTGRVHPGASGYREFSWPFMTKMDFTGRQDTEANTGEI